MLQTTLVLDKKSGVTLQQQLINQIRKSIAAKELEAGEILPSINLISNELNISRDTVFKAYRQLRKLEIIDSTPAKGYFVREQLKKVLLVLDYFSPFKEILHNAIKNGLSNEFSIDVVFHHYNQRMFKNIIQQNSGFYDAFVIMNMDTEGFKIHPVLKKVDPSRLILVDIPVKEWGDLSPEKFSCVFQDFDQAVYDQLEKIKNQILAYNRFNLINTRQLNHPLITEEYFIRFCYDHNIDCRIYNNMKDVNVAKGEAFFILRQHDLADVLEQCRNLQLKSGHDVGIISFNDNPLYNFIENGITVISTDFEEMGRKTAELIVSKKTQKITIPTGVVLRGSL